MPDWSKEIRERLEGLKVTPEREAAIVEEIAQHLERPVTPSSSPAARPPTPPGAPCSTSSPSGLAPALSRALPPSAPSRLPPADEGGGWLSGLAKDFRYGARRLRLEPAFAFVAILSLALGIGANTAIFQLIDAVRLRGLPVAEPQELYNVRIAPSRGGRTGNFSGRYPQMTTAVWERIGAEQKAFSKLAAWSSDRVNLSPGGEARYAEGLWVSGTFFDTVGVGPLRGRVLGSADDTPGCAAAAVVVSERFWRRELGGRDLSRGETLTVEGRRFEIVGVTPARFFGVEVGRAFDVALPLCAENLVSESPRTRISNPLRLVDGRPSGGSTPDGRSRGRTPTSPTIAPGVFESTLPTTTTPGTRSTTSNSGSARAPSASGLSALRAEYEPALAPARDLGARSPDRLRELANLMVARASARRREIAVRLALGASRAAARPAAAGREPRPRGRSAPPRGAALAQGLGRFLVAFLSTDDSPWFVEPAPRDSASSPSPRAWRASPASSSACSRRPGRATRVRSRR